MGGELLRGGGGVGGEELADEALDAGARGVFRAELVALAGI
jgi:hypothetical protein